MRVTVSHNKQPQEVKQIIDRGLEDVFKSMPVGAIEIMDQQRNWSGNTLFFSFNARAAFMTLPIKGSVQVDEKLVIIEVDLPPIVSQFIPEEKIKSGLETRVKGLLT